MAIRNVVQSGPWSDDATWDTKPIAGDSVANDQFILTIDVDTLAIVEVALAQGGAAALVGAGGYYNVTNTHLLAGGTVTITGVAIKNLNEESNPTLILVNSTVESVDGSTKFTELHLDNSTINNDFTINVVQGLLGVNNSVITGAVDTNGVTWTGGTIGRIQQDQYDVSAGVTLTNVQITDLISLPTVSHTVVLDGTIVGSGKVGDGLDVMTASITFANGARVRGNTTITCDSGFHLIGSGQFDGNLTINAHPYDTGVIGSMGGVLKIFGDFGVGLADANSLITFHGTFQAFGDFNWYPFQSASDATVSLMSPAATVVSVQGNTIDYAGPSGPSGGYGGVIGLGL